MQNRTTVAQLRRGSAGDGATAQAHTENTPHYAMQPTREHPKLVEHVPKHTRQPLFPKVDDTLCKSSMRHGELPIASIQLEVPVQLHCLLDFPANGVQSHEACGGHTRRTDNALQCFLLVSGGRCPHVAWPGTVDMQARAYRAPEAGVGVLARGGSATSCPCTSARTHKHVATKHSGVRHTFSETRVNHPGYAARAYLMPASENPWWKPIATS